MRLSCVCACAQRRNCNCATRSRLCERRAIGYPPPVLGSVRPVWPAPAPPFAPPQVIIIIRRLPNIMAPQFPPPGVGLFPFVRRAVAPRVDVAQRSVPPDLALRGSRCGWQPGCAPRPEHYRASMKSPDPHVYLYPGPASRQGREPSPPARTASCLHGPKRVVFG